MRKNDNETCAQISQRTEEIIRGYGLFLEVHQVTTEDGYINTLYRISKSPKDSQKKQAKLPVLIIHGLTSSAAESILQQRHLGIYLADNGFDVWLGNCRGTTYSRGHTQFDHVKDPEKYWNFSFHEIGYYDNPAFVDHILNETGFNKLIYVGFSQGTTALTIFLSTRPEYNEKIALSCLLCPAIIFGNSFPMRFLFCFTIPWVQSIADFFHIRIYDCPIISSARRLGFNYCKPNTWRESLFMKFFEFVCGLPNPDKKYGMELQSICTATPNSASQKQFLHFSQLIKGKRFTRYDYGPTENMKIYESHEPPMYDISKVTAPVSLFYSKNDMFYDTGAIDVLATKFSNCVHKYMVEHDKFNHLNFLYHEDIIPLLYSHVLDLINKYV